MLHTQQKNEQTLCISDCSDFKFPQLQRCVGTENKKSSSCFIAPKRWLFLYPSPLSSLWQAQQVASMAWMDAEGSPRRRPPLPSTHCDWQRWQAALKIRPSCASESVPGQSLSYASVMVFQPLVPSSSLSSLWWWLQASVYQSQPCQLFQAYSSRDLAFTAWAVLWKSSHMWQSRVEKTEKLTLITINGKTVWQHCGVWTI